MHRRRFLATLGASSLGISGCALTFSDGVFNACAAQLPDRLRTHPLVAAAWQGLDASQVWDMHCHVFGNGDSGSGLWFNPALERLWPLEGYLQRLFYLNASCAHEAPGKVDASVVDRLLNQCQAMPHGFRVLLYAFDWARDDAGRPDRERSTFYVPDDYCAMLAARHPRYVMWAASIHPYDPAAIDRLDAAAARGARAVKWLPSAQGIDPASARCNRFYARLAELRMPLITHAGDERAVQGFGEALGNPLRLRRPLDAGVRVVVAHCASLGAGHDLDRGANGAMVANFDLFARLMDDPRYGRNVAGDLSAVAQGNRVDVVATLLARRDWHARLLNGSDYPLPGVLPLISLPLLIERGLLDPAAAQPLKELRDHNVLLFDFVLKRSVVNNGAGFARPVFETRSFFRVARLKAASMATHSQYDLLREKRFAPFFWTQFLGAGNDNIYKNALIIFVAYRTATHGALDANTLVNLAAGLFILPFVLLSASAGQLADKYEKSHLIRLIKLFEIAIMAIGTIGFFLPNLFLLFGALFLMGVHSTLFGPVKYAILPQHLRPEELVGGNGLVEMGTFVSILIGTIVGGLLVAIPGVGPVLAGVSAVVVAIAGWLVSRAIPYTPAVDPGLVLNWNPFTETWKNLRFAYGNRIVWLSMLGISWFWFYGATFLTQFPNFAKDILGGDEHVVTLLLALFSIGIGTGSLLCERLSGRKVEIGLVPFGSIGLTVFAIDLWFASRDMHATALYGVAAFLSQPGHWRVVADLMLIGLFGGFYIVPLYALIQERSDPAYRSRIIAANNILNAVFMVASAGLSIALLGTGLTIPYLFLVTGILNAVIAIFIYQLVPEFLMRFLAWILIHTLYRVKKEGLDNVPDTGGCIVVCNHVSYVDALVIAACVRRPIRFVMDHRIFRNPLLSWLFRTMQAIPVASAREDSALKESAFKAVAKALQAGEVVGIFPEGSLTSDGEVARFRPGIERMLQDTPVPVVPMALRGLWGSFFSRSFEGKAMRRWRGTFSRIALVVAPAMPPERATAEALQAQVTAMRGSAR